MTVSETPASSGYEITGFKTTEKLFEFKKFVHHEKPLTEHQVYVKIKACGVCHTDMDYAPVPNTVLGHEAVGEIVHVGSSVKSVKPGDLVGFAYLKNSCNDCLLCHSGDDIMCRKRVMFPEGLNNGYAYSAVCDGRYVYKIPDGIEAKHAGPLMCAGATVFSAMYNINLSPTARIAIVGIGGLGHLGLQFARAWGCHVVAISTSRDKEEEALKFGAHEYWCSKDFTPEFIEKAEKFDMILNTVAVNLDYQTYLDLLAPNGDLRMVGIPQGEIKFGPILPFLLDQKKFTGAILGGRKLNTLMLRFAARHKIRPQIEEFPMTEEGIQTAIHHLRDGKPRYRGVLITPEEDKQCDDAQR
ncbi:chaperonin 10-like protein [Zychaea mexicana]|uniref:chaperonin 10-like protein n=1 Tax=Zychaea mexicana TaxID=64656 RepID=UPI0022FEF3E9|nr:chaperonin 10-like protein [Zychaea mexicana]KAI9492577.1 chaperonin 10-like protein [Zychaea mexicana]